MLLSPTVKEVLKSVNIFQSYERISSGCGLFVAHRVYPLSNVIIVRIVNVVVVVETLDRYHLANQRFSTAATLQKRTQREPKWPCPL